MSARQLALEALKSLWNQKPDGKLNGDSMSSKCINECQTAIAALETEIAREVEPVAQSVITALRFYANSEHYSLDGLDEFDTVSGEPQNWLCSGRDESATMIEDGSIARRALRGEPVEWIDGDEDDTPKPIEGEALFTAPQAVNAAMFQALQDIAGGTYDTWTEGYRAQQIAIAALAKAEGTKP